MKERPILFSAPMVRALLDGSKTQTRRIVKIKGSPPSGPFWDHKGYKPVPFCGGWTFGYVETGVPSELAPKFLCPYGVPGDRLWVRETFSPYVGIAANDEVFHRADYLGADIEAISWKPSIFMEKKHCRLHLEVTAVRVERLQDISEGDAKAEGVRADSWDYPVSTRPATSAYRTLWDSLNAKRGFGWATNPWVWAITFKRITPTPGESG